MGAAHPHPRLIAVFVACGALRRLAGDATIPTRDMPGSKDNPVLQRYQAHLS